MSEGERTTAKRSETCLDKKHRTKSEDKSSETSITCEKTDLKPALCRDASRTDPLAHPPQHRPRLVPHEARIPRCNRRLPHRKRNVLFVSCVWLGRERQGECEGKMQKMRCTREMCCSFQPSAHEVVWWPSTIDAVHGYITASRPCTPL